MVGRQCRPTAATSRQTSASVALLNDTSVVWRVCAMCEAKLDR